MKIIILNLPFILYVLTGYLFAQLVLPTEMAFIKAFMASGMVLHGLYLGLRILAAPVILPRIQNTVKENYPRLTKRDGWINLALGVSTWMLSFLVLN